MGHITDEQVSAIAQDPTVRRLLSEAESGAMGWRTRAEQTVRAVLTAAEEVGASGSEQ